jgi:hypothetical protein
MAQQTTVVARQWLSSVHVVTPTDERNNYTAAGVFYAVRAEKLQEGPVSCCNSPMWGRVRIPPP